MYFEKGGFSALPLTFSSCSLDIPLGPDAPSHTKEKGTGFSKKSGYFAILSRLAAPANFLDRNE